MMRVFSNYDLKDILAYQAIPFVTIRAMVNFDNKELAKAQRFSWEKIGDKVYTKQWVKRIKQDRFEEEKQACAAFKIVVID
jgi:hypothetical protein